MYILIWNELRCPSGPGSFYFVEELMDKVFKTYDEQINILAARGVDISTPEKRSYAKKALQHYGYYNLINGYKKPFLKSESEDSGDVYKNGTTINELRALYDFDDRLRKIFLKYILVVESNLKSLIAYSFSQAHGHENYLIYTNFNTNMRDANKYIMEVIADIQKQLSYHTGDPCISHYLKNYGYVPLWVLNSILTLGTMSKFYKIMKQPERQNVSKPFKLMDNELENILMYITPIRNFCAHNNRLYCYRTKNPLTDTKIHATLNIPRLEEGKHEYAYGKRDLFAVMIALHPLLPKLSYKKMIKELSNALNIFRKNMVVLQENEILDMMGFPESWKEDLLSI